MPIGVICDAASVALGGLFGSWVGGCLSPEFKRQINLVFSVCSMGMGIASIVLMRQMPAVVFALIAGSAVGLAFRLGRLIQRGAAAMRRLIPTRAAGEDAGAEELLVTALVLFCASGTGIYGAMTAGLTGDHSILAAKSILDFFTAIIFACNLGAVVSLVSIPQAVIFLLLFFCAKSVYPLCSEAMVADFKACGGFIMLCTGLRMAKLGEFPIADMLPAMILVMPVSRLWTAVLLPLTGG